LKNGSLGCHFIRKNFIPVELSFVGVHDYNLPNKPMDKEQLP